MNRYELAVLIETLIHPDKRVIVVTHDARTQATHQCPDSEARSPRRESARRAKRDVASRIRRWLATFPG